MPVMKVTAKPLTKEELEKLRWQATGYALPTGQVVPQPPTDHEWSRIEATIEHGWAKDPLTPADLDAWAAEHIMGWHRGRNHWVDRHDTAQYPSDEWRPSQNLGQALECVAESDYWCQAEVSLGGIATLNFVRPEVAGSQTIYEGPYDEGAISESILRTLHEALS